MKRTRDSTRYSCPTIATSVARMPARQETTCNGETNAKSGRESRQSNGSSNNMLNALLPNTLPMARSMAPRRKAASIENSSGKDVLTATSVVPMNVLPKPDSVTVPDA